MSSKIVRSILTVASTILIVTLVIITAYIYQYFGGVQDKLLSDQLDVATQGTEEMGEEFLAQLKTENYRITLIAPTGKVLFDSEMNAGEMGNHSDRKEVKEALKYGQGSSSRYSVTLTEKTLYRAVLLSDGNVLRVSSTRISAAVLVVGMLPIILALIFLSLILSMILGNSMAKRIVDPLNKLDLDKPLENDAYEELSPLLRRIDSQHREINRQIMALKQKRDEFNQIIGSMHEGLVMLDNKDRIVSINAAAKELFEPAGVCIGKEFITIYRKNDINSAIEAAKVDGHATFRSQVNGLEYQFDFSRIEFEGDAIGVVILAFDITEQVEAERMRREFAANVSHELKTPLQGILGYTDLIEQGFAKAEDVPRFVGHIRKEATRLVSLIEDIIRLSQLDEDLELALEDVNLLQVAEEVVDSLSDVAHGKGIEVCVKGEAIHMKGVHRLLYEIVYNLCENGIKYNEAGGRVDVNVEESDKCITLKVADTGIGIAPSHQKYVFERFYRVDKSHSKQSGGTGLGLSIVKHAVAYHNGSIQMDSEVGEGTVITVKFPR